MSKQTLQYKFLEDGNNLGDEFSKINKDEFLKVKIKYSLEIIITVNVQIPTPKRKI